MKIFTTIIGVFFVFLNVYAKPTQECKLPISYNQAEINYPSKYEYEDIQDFTILSFNKKTKTGIAYNENCIITFSAKGSQLKSIKDCGIKDLQHKEPVYFESQISSIKKNIYERAYQSFQTDSINKRQTFVKDSLEKRSKFVSDSIRSYNFYVKDSITEYEEYLTLSLKLDSMRAAFSSIKALKDKKDKEFWGSKGSPVAINMVRWNQNSVGGITAKFQVLNLSRKTIKYVAISGYFKNSVGDRVYNQIGSGSTYTVRGIGPIGPAPASFVDYELFADAMGTYDFDDCFFYSRTANSIEVSSVKLTYTDGTTQTVSGKTLEKQLYWKEDDLLDAVYDYKNYIDFLKTYNGLEVVLSEEITYKPKEYKPLEYKPATYFPTTFKFDE